MHSIFRICFVFSVVSILGGASHCSANEVLRIIGMGGTRIASDAEADAGVFGNPAGLTNVLHHTLAFNISTESLSWTAQAEHKTQQFGGSFNADVHPAVYYSKHVGIILENLFQPESVHQHPRLFGLGVAYDPKDWLVVRIGWS